MPDSGSEFGDTAFGDAAGEEDVSDFDPAIDEWAAVDPPAAVVSAGSSEADVDTAGKQQPGTPAAALSNATVAHPAPTAAAAAAGAAAPETTAHTKQGVNAPAATAPTAQPQSSAPAFNAQATHAPAAPHKPRTGTATASSAPQPHSTAAAQTAAAGANVAGPSSRSSQAAVLPSATASKAASAGGWGLSTGGWGFSALSSKLQQVAIGAVADAKELGETFTKAMADMTADDEDEVEKLSAYQTPHAKDPAALPLEQGTSALAPPTMVTTREESQHGGAAGFRALEGGSGFGGDEEGLAAGMTAEQRAAEQRRLEILRRLEGEPVQLEAGLKVIDERVEQLASGAAKAIGSLWGGLTSLSSKVEAATLVLAKELVDTLEEGVSTVSRQAEKGLETAFGGRIDQPAGTSRSQHQRSSSATQEALSFDHAFYVYGGRQSHEELEALSNDCARISNKARSKLDAAARARLDGALQQLAPYFDLDTPFPPATAQLDPSSSAPAPADPSAAPQPSAAHQHATADADHAAVSTAPEDIHEIHELLEGQYAPMAAQLKRAGARAEELAAAAHALAASHTAAAAIAAAAAGQQGNTSGTASSGQQGETQVGEIQAEEDDAEAAQQQQQQEEEDVQKQQRAGEASSRALQAWLYDVQAAAVKALASLASGQQMMLLNLGRSVASPARFGKDLDDGISWPANGPAIAAILRTQATTMLADLQAAGACFQRLLPILATLFAQHAQTQAGSGAVQQQQQQQQQDGQKGPVVPSSAKGGLAEQLAAALEADVSMAVSRVREGFRALLYVVLLASVHRDGLQEQAKQQQQQQQQQEALPVPSTAAGLV